MSCTVAYRKNGPKDCRKSVKWANVSPVRILAVPILATCGPKPSEPAQPNPYRPFLKHLHHGATPNQLQRTYM